MTGQAASALTNISGTDLAFYVLAGLCAAGLAARAAVKLGSLLLDIAVIAWQLSRFVIRRQRHIAAIAAIDGAQRPTRAMDLGDLVIHPEQERHAAWQAGRLSETRADLPAVRCHRHRTGSTAWPCTCGTETGGAS